MPWFIYRITNLVNRKIYVGKTDNVERRWYDHCYDAKHNTGFYFQRAIRKYGEDAFSISILETYKNEQTALDREKALIRELNTRNPQVGYNVAEGGLGGHTMTQEQIENQRAIKICDHPKFIEAFNAGLTQREIAKLFHVSVTSVIRCIKQLRLERVRYSRTLSDELRLQRKSERLQRLHEKRNAKKMSPEVYSQFRAGVMIRVNKTRGINNEIKKQVLEMYFGPEEMSAREIANKLQIGHGSVRCTISNAYAMMDEEERKTVKHKRASSVRSGDKNANSRARRSHAS